MQKPTKEMAQVDVFVRLRLADKEAHRHAAMVAQPFLSEPRTYIVAFLHDIVEDGHATQEELKEKFHLDYEQMEALDAITRKKGEEYFKYIQRVKECPMARRIKRQDLMHNIFRCAMSLKQNTDDKISRLERYVKAYRILA